MKRREEIWSELGMRKLDKEIYEIKKKMAGISNEDAIRKSRQVTFIL
jgi:hypothetical protein